jgi:ubiquinone/menaquinone biosynthesis C-methylase UbiE
MAFFDHYSSNMPTGIGRGFVKRAAGLLFSKIICVAPDARFALEIGPGRGDFCQLWQRADRKIVALEANPELGHELSEKGVEVVNCFAPPLPFEDSQFDVVVASHVIEHMPTVNKAIELIEEMARVCDSRGLVCIVAPDVRSWRYDFWNADYTHNYVTSPRRIEQLFTNAGLKIETIVAHSCFADGITGWFLKSFARILPVELIGVLPIKALWIDKFYKLKLTFLGNFLVIGRKT